MTEQHYEKKVVRKFLIDYNYFSIYIKKWFKLNHFYFSIMNLFKALATPDSLLEEVI